MQHINLLPLTTLLIGFGFLVSMSSPLTAQSVTPADAMTKARNLELRCSSRRSAGRDGLATAQPTLAYTRQDQQHTYYYAFDYPEGGYAIIGGDAAAREVLGYVPEGNFDLEQMPDGLRYMLQCYEQEIAWAIEHPMPMATSEDGESDPYPRLIPAYDPHQWLPVKQMLTTLWGQTNPYSSELPSRYLKTGCMTTAAAQVMKYYNYPTTGIGFHQFDRTIEGTTYTFTADFEHTTYDWANMHNSYVILGDDYNAEQAKAVGTLMYHVGVALNTWYGFDQSSSYWSCAEFLPTYFGYSDKAQLIRRNEMEGYGWDQIIHNELLAGHPVYYGGTAPVGGHAFVIDGYDPNSATFHINWGWNGGSDGWFSLIGDGYLGRSEAYNFDQDQIAYVGFVPDTQQYAERQLLGVKFEAEEFDVAIGGQLKLRAKIFPEDATNQTLTWTSDAPYIATVDSMGVVRGLEEGFCFISARSTQGNKAAAICRVNVLKDGEIAIGSQQDWSSDVPFANNCSNATIQMLYTSDEMGSSCIINSLSFKSVNNLLGTDEYLWWYPTLEIWMGLTENDVLDPENPAIDATNLKKVYRREDFGLGYEDGWQEFELDSVYCYDNNYNLLVVASLSSSGGGQPVDYAVSNTTDVKCMYRGDWGTKYSDIYNTTEYYEASEVRPIIKFTKVLDFMGKVGTDYWWDFSLADYSLHVYGTGKLSSYSNPWSRLCQLIRSVVVEEGITGFSFGSSTTSELKSVSLPSTVETVSLPAGSLEEIKVAAGNAWYSDGGGQNVLIDLQTHTLKTCGIKSCYIPEGITTIYFRSCLNNQSQSIILPNSVTTIDNYAFDGALLSEVYIPDNVTAIGQSSFINCPNLTSIIVGKNNTVYDSRDNCNAIIETATNKLIAGSRAMIVPQSVVNISPYAFSPGPASQTFDIPESVEKASSVSFSSDIKHKPTVSVLRLPSTATQSIKDITNQMHLKRLYVGPTPFRLSSSDFSLTDAEKGNEHTLYVPQGCIDAYKSQWGWKNFTTFVEYCDATTLANLATMLYSLDVTTRRGEQTVIPLYLKNAETLTGFGGKLELPTGVVPVTDSSGKPVVTFVGDRCGDNYTYTASWSSGGILTLNCKTGVIAPGEGVVAYVSVDVTLDAQGGGQLLQLQELSVTPSSGAAIALVPYVSSFIIGHYLAGDVNQDGVIDRLDVECIADFIRGTSSRLVEVLADPNHDGSISIADLAVEVERVK